MTDGPRYPCRGQAEAFGIVRHVSLRRCSTDFLSHWDRSGLDLAQGGRSVVPGIHDHRASRVGWRERTAGAVAQETVERLLDLLLDPVRTAIAHLRMLRAGMDDVDAARFGFFRR